MGESLGQQYAANDLGLSETDFVSLHEPDPAIGYYGMGFDDVRVDSQGNTWIVEYKGGSSDLGPNQMSPSWVKNNIAALQQAENPWGDLLKQAQSNGTLKGVAISTPWNANGVSPGTTTVIGTWSY